MLLFGKYKIATNQAILIALMALITGALSVFLPVAFDKLGADIKYSLAIAATAVATILLFFLSLFRISWAIGLFIIILPIVSRLKTIFLVTLGPFEISIESIFIFILLLGWFARLAVNKDKIVREPLGVWILFFILTGVISISSAKYPLESSRVLFAGIVQPVIFYYILINNVRDRKSIKLTIYALIFSIFIASSYSLFQLFSLSGFSPHGILEYRLPSVYYNPLIFAETLILTMPLLFVASISRLFPVIWRKFALLVLLISLFALMLTYSRGAAVALAASTSLLFIKEVRIRRLAYKAIPFIVLALILQWGLISSIFMRRLPTMQYLSEPSNAITERLNGWQSSLTMISDRPLTGVGLGMFKYNYPQYMISEAILQLESAHNLYLNIAVEMGILGLIFFLIILGIIIKRAIFLTKSKDPFIKDISLGLLASAAGYSVLVFFGAEFVHKHMFTNMLLFWTIIGLIIILGRCKLISEKEKLS